MQARISRFSLTGSKLSPRQIDNRREESDRDQDILKKECRIN